MIEYVDVVALKPLGGYKVWVRFSNGKEGVRDFSAMVADGGEMTEALKDEAVFRGVHIRHGVPSWPNGFDIDATNLHMEMEEANLLSSSAAAE